MKHWSVDSVIECLTFRDGRHQVQRDLMAAAPNAYDEEVLMDKIWKKLPESTQALILAAYEREVGGLRL